MTLHPVQSATIAEIGYDPAASKMAVQFHGGKKYQFANVTPAQHQTFLTSESLGRHFGAAFRDNARHPCVRIG